MDKTQSLLAALFGWTIGTYTMWFIGFGSLTSLVGGLFVGIPLAFIFYAPHEFWVELRQRASNFTVRKQRSGSFSISMRRDVAQLALVARNALAASLLVSLWAVEVFLLLVYTAGVEPEYPDHFLIGIGLFCVLSGIVSFMVAELLFRDRYIAPFRELSDARKEQLSWALSLLGPINFFVMLVAFGLIVARVAGKFLLEVVRATVITVCCSGRLIAMASVIVGLSVNHIAGVTMGLVSLVSSWAIQLFLVHDWAVAQRELWLAENNSTIG